MNAPAAQLPAKIDPAQARMVQELKHGSALFGCRIDPSGQFVFASAQNNALVRWRLSTGQKTEYVGHRSWPRGIAFAAPHNLVYSGDYSGRILAWPLDGDYLTSTAYDTPQALSCVQAHDGWCRALAVSPDGRLLASCGNDRLVKLWSIPEGKPAGVLGGHESHVYNIAFHPSLPLLASADHKGIVKVWDLDKGTLERELDAKSLYRYDTLFSAGLGGIRSMAFSDNGGLLTCAGVTNVTNAFQGGGNPAVLLFDWATGKQLQLLQSREAFNGTALGVAFHPAGFIAAVAAHDNGILSFWKPEAAADVFTLKFPDSPRDLALHPDGRRLAIAFSDGMVRIYDLGAAA